MNDVFGYPANSRVCHSVRACIDRVIASAPEGAVFVESGGFLGHTSQHWVDKLRASKKQFTFYVIDNWKLENVTEKHDDNLAFFMENVGEDRIKDINIVSSDAIQAIQLFKDNSVYFLFLDDDHTYAHVTKQIGLWLPKLTSNGIMAGDDYYCADVYNAVHDWFNHGDIESLYNNSGFLVQNPKQKNRVIKYD